MNFGNLGHGLQTGLQYIADWIKLLLWAFEHKVEAVPDGIAVAKQFLQEIGGLKGIVTQQFVATLLGALLFGAFDPFAGSRHLLQTALEKWGHH